MAGFSAVRATSEAIRTLLDERRPRALSDLNQVRVQVVRTADFENGIVKTLNVGISILLHRVAASPLRRNFPIRQLSDGGAKRTPAMAAGLSDHRWTVSELLHYRVAPPRWQPPKRRRRRSKQLQALIERWGPDAHH